MPLTPRFIPVMTFNQPIEAAMKQKLIVFESLERLVSEAWEYRPNNCKCNTVIRNGLISRYDTPTEIIELRWNHMDVRGMRPHEIVTVGVLKPAMQKIIKVIKASAKERNKDVG